MCDISIQVSMNMLAADVGDGNWESISAMVVILWLFLGIGVHGRVWYGQDDVHVLVLIIFS